MGVLSKLKEIVGIEDVEDDEEEAVEERKPFVPQQKPAAPMSARSVPAHTPSAGSAGAAAPKMPSPNTAKYTNQFKMVVIEPQGFDECPRLVDSLKAKKPVIINLENLETDTARKIFDFLSGATYALNGNVQKVANNIFVFAPENVNVDYSNNQRADRASDTVKSPWR